MSTKYLLDSSVLIQLFKKDSVVRQKIAAIETGNVYIASIASGELYYGAEHSSMVERNRAEVEALQRLTVLLPVDAITARVYGLLKHQQQMKGLILPDNDLWIAASAIQYGLTLAARDNHFNWVNGLSLEQW